MGVRTYETVSGGEAMLYKKGQKKLVRSKKIGKGVKCQKKWHF